MQWKVLVSKRQEAHEKMAEFWDVMKPWKEWKGFFQNFTGNQNKKQKTLFS